MTRITVVGDAMLDHDLTGTVDRVCPDAPVPVVDVATDSVRPGGAALAAHLLAADGVDVRLVTAVGRDGPGRALMDLLGAGGVEVVDLGLDGATPEKVRVRANGQSLLRIDRGGRAQPGPWTSSARRALDGCDAVLVSDYGRGVVGAELRGLLGEVGSRQPIVWDPHPRGAPPPAGVALATPSEAEAEHFAPDATQEAGSLAAAADRAAALLERWGVKAVAVTMGARGALLARPSASCLVVPTPVAHGGDACGAGDRFAGAAAHALAAGAIVPEAVEAAVAAASDFVASGGAAGREPEAARDQAAPTLVATGGCFDLLHAGHVALLEAAARLGDRLVVLLNGDESVRRLKGPGRPLQRAEDRRRVLLALGCVDEVIVFDEDTPVAALDDLRPHVFVKGADYALDRLPEAEVVARWGGRAVLVPYLDGRSTTRLMEEVVARVHP